MIINTKEQVELANDEDAKQRQIKVFSIKAYADCFYYSKEEQNLYNDVEFQKLTEKEKESYKQQANKLREEHKKDDILILKSIRLIEKDIYFSKTEDNKIISKIKKSNTILMFESALSRELGIKPVELGLRKQIDKIREIEPNKATTDIFIIRFDKDEMLNKILISEGFIFNNEKYIYLTSSAGQIRTKKGLFVKEKLWNEHKDTLMCGLTAEIINQKGGMISNKYLSYMALFTSSTKEWEDFNIDSCILVDDFETNVDGIVDFIDSEKFTIDEKVKCSVPINHSDGCGMIDINICDKAFSFRLPWFKGLLVPVDFKSFAKENNIKELNGKPIDEISIIFTKSQFKAVDYYDSFKEYQADFKKYKCKACKCITEKNKEQIKDSQLSYQILQTLTDITDEEMKALVQKSNNYLNRIGSDKDAMIECIAKGNKSIKNIFELYPNLLADKHIRDEITDIRRGIEKKCKYGKLKIDGKYTFIVPDVVAWMQNLFLKEQKPKGILEDGQISCSLLNDKEKLDCVRSPHCYREHSININIRNMDTRKWFATNCLYTSCHSLMSKLLQFDVDGDQSLVINDEILVTIAERNMQGIVPLYYEMPKGKKTEINSNNIYEGLKAGWKSKGIAEYSDSFTKAWNFQPSIKITEADKLEVIKYLCLLNNFAVDFAKTLYQPTVNELPRHIQKNFKKIIGKKYPYFFRHKVVEKKDKEQTKNICEDKKSMVDKLEDYIEKIDIVSIETIIGQPENIVKEKIMLNPEQKVDSEVTKIYNKINQAYYNYFDDSYENTNSVYSTIRELLRMDKYSDGEVCDILIKSLFRNNTHSKKLLFRLYFPIIEQNILKNMITDFKECKSCGEKFKPKSNRQLVCEICREKVIKEKDRERKKK